MLGSAGADGDAGGWELSSAVLGATGEPGGVGDVGVRLGVKDDALGGEFLTSCFISAFSKISSRGETGAGFGDAKSIGDLTLVLKTLSKSVR